MSELQEAIQEMRNMRESYDQLAEAAEAYNEGKPALAEAITAKGVEAAATDSLATMAEKVMTISQDTYEIDGGEMYAKQLFGSLETPNYWNLYDILAQLLSDGRLVNYGGILLAEYYKGYDSLALAGAGAGGAYVVSDKDSNGNFIMYTEDTTHTWNTKEDGKGNRWVAYCFADEYHNFQITDTNTSPRSIFIGRKVGTITNLVNGRCSQIVVPDGNKLNSFTGNYTQTWDKRVVMRNVNSCTLYMPTTVESIYIEREQNNLVVIGDNFSAAFTIGALICLNKQDNIGSIAQINQSNSLSSNRYINEIIIKGGVTCGKILHGLKSNGDTVLEDIEELTPGTGNDAVFWYCSLNKLFLLSIEKAETNKRLFVTANSTYGANYIYIGYKTNDKNRSVLLGSNNIINTLVDIELKDGYCKTLDISQLTGSLTEANMYAHILQRLKQDEAGCGDGVTITLGSTNLAKLTSQESIDLLDLLTNTYGYTFA